MGHFLTRFLGIVFEFDFLTSVCFLFSILNLPSQETKQLNNEFFGVLAPLSYEEHYDLYTNTGIDIDDRFEFLHWICETYESDLMSYIRFCKDLPEFTDLPLADQMSLVRSELT